MLRENKKTYKWKKYDRLILAAASLIGWLPVSWVVYLTGYLLWIVLLSSVALPVPEIKLWSYIIICMATQIMVFGIFAYSYPKVYILPTWLVCLVGFILSFRRIVASIIDSYDPNILNYSSGLTDYYSISWLNIFLAIFMLFSLVTLFRPALFYFRVIWHKITR